MTLHRRGDLAQAQRVYEEILHAEPRHFDALHLLGVIACQLKDFARGADLIERALVLAPSQVAAHINRGAALKELGRHEAALESYDRAIAINPAHALAHYNRGNLLKTLGRPDEALTAYDRAIRINPLHAESHYNRGLVFQELGDLAASLKSYDCAIAVRPDYAEAHYNRGLVLQAQDRPVEAIAGFDRALSIRPDHAEAHANRGMTQRTLRQWDEALASLARAIALKPEYPEAYFFRALVFKDLLRFDASLADYDRAIALKPELAEAHSNRGVLLFEANRLTEAIAAYDRAIELKPDFAQAYENRGYAELLDGRLETGWVDYEWRLKKKPPAGHGTPPEPAPPRWHGAESLDGKTLLLHGEQGLGDMIQFCRYATLAADSGATVILQTEASLMTLFRTLRGVSRVIERGAALPPVDYHCPLMSLPLAFGTTLATIPASVPYLAASPDKIRDWRELLGPRTGLRVGLVWSGGHRPERPDLHEVNRRRNIPLAALEPIAQPEVEFYSLQKGPVAQAELSRLMASGWAGPVMRDFTARLDDFSDTAAFIEQLDLLISVDTSTAHLAGALGKPVWLLNRFDSCWRWMLHRPDSPWYPSITLYRQEAPGDWAGVVEHVRADLLALAGAST